ncbi:MAG: hypothetical protein E7220_01445 [Clostridiales bacterium]|nr:hypothetical protein [Clostridiales bacterium]
MLKSLQEYHRKYLISVQAKTWTSMNNLFLSGNIRIGKSSLIRKCLIPYKNVLGGFSSQRLLDKSGKVVGYRLADADDFDVDRLSDPALSNVFISFEDGVRTTDLSVFEDNACRMLTPRPGTRIMLLDEIGGLELRSEIFRSSIYELLRSDTPCIGVIKSKVRQPEEQLCNKDLRNYLANDPGSTIIELDNNDPLYEKGSEEILVHLEETISDFLGSVI